MFGIMLLYPYLKILKNAHMWEGNVTNMIKIRAVLSSILLVVFIAVLIITVGVLYTIRTGHTFLGISKAELFNARNILGPIMNILIIIHLIINWGLYKRELKVLFKR